MHKKKRVQLLSLFITIFFPIIIAAFLTACGGGGSDPTANNPANNDSSSIPPGSMLMARNGHTATRLSNGKVLITGGYVSTWDITSSSELYDPATGIFKVIGNMTTPRDSHTATLLPSGKVLITGGNDNSGNTLSSMEQYDPATNTFTDTGSMITARYLHTVTLLPNGKVLIAGGYDKDDNPLSSAELYDPATDTFTPTSRMAPARVGHTATLLSNGKVLISGGWNDSKNSAFSSAELYDPAKGTFTAIGNMLIARDGHTATLLPNGNVLITGGGDSKDAFSSAELFDPATNVFTVTGSMTTSRDAHTATLLSNGKVLILGGYNSKSDAFSSAELYDPSTGTFTAINSMVSVSISPGSASVATGGSQTFTAMVTGTTNTKVTWSVQEGVSGGTITSEGVYTAPLTAGTYHIIAASQADPNKSARGAIDVKPGSTGVVRLPKTGQTTCYDSAGTIIPCAGTGQDGDITAGVSWPSPRFIVSGDCVTDNLTGLMWVKNPDSIPRSWQQAMDYANGLSLCGYSDWRLPNVNELESLVNAGQGNSATWLNMQGFTNVQSVYYLSSTTFAGYPDSARIVNMWYGYVGGYYKSYDGYYVWPVRSGQAGSFGNSIISLPRTGQTTCYDTAGAVIPCAGRGQDGEIQSGVAWPNPRFTDNGNAIVTDNLTGLMWTKDGNAPGPVACSPATTKTWQGALDYVACLNTNSYLGYNDWRLSNRNELMSLANREQANTATWLNTQGFNNVVQSDYYYWSSTTYAGYPGYAWFVGMWNGGVGSYNKSYDGYYVWPVRSGQ